MDLAFITDTHLRQRIEDSIEYIYALYEESKQDYKHGLYQTETYRVIILYTVAIIEAVLLYLYEKRGVPLTKLESKETHYLPETYRNMNIEGRVFLGVEKVVRKSESEISLRELVQFLVREKILKNETAEKLHLIMQTRNSVHLRFKGVHTCTIEQVEEALDMLVYVLAHAPRSLKQTP